MSIDVNTIGVGVETKEVTTATRELDKFGKSADSASRKADNLGSSSKRTAKDVDALQSSSSGAVASLGRMAAGISAIAVAGSLIRTIDEYTKFTAQLKLATRSQQEYTAALSDVTRIANTAQVSLSSIGTLYARLNNALREVGVSQTQVAKITENVGLALKISGATASEASSAMLQLSQAFGSGVLRGEEFNAVSEAAPALMRALAESIGVPIGQLRQLASDGKITSEVLAKAFGDDKLLETYRKQAKEINTIGGAWQYLTNQITLSIGEMNKATKASSLLIESLKAVGGFVGEKNPFQILGFAARATQNRLNQMMGIETPTTKGAVSGNAIFGNSNPITSGSSTSPNFNANVQAQNIDEIHRKQDEAARKANEYQEKLDKVTTDRKLRAIEQEYDSKATKMANHLDAIARQVDIEEAADKEKQERLKVYMEYQQKLANENFKAAQDYNKKIEDERLKEFEKTTDAINNIFREGFANLVNGGMSSWKAFTKSLATTFKTAVADKIYKLFAEPFVVKLVASVLGLGVSGASSASSLVASSGGSGSIGSIFSGIKDVISAGNGSIVSSIESLGTFLSTGNGGLGDTLGGFIGQYSTQIANVLPYTGAFLQALSGDVKGAAFTAAGTAIGSIWGPIGGAIGGMLGGLVGGLFGGEKIPRYSSQSETTYANGQFSTVSGTPAYKSLGATSQATALNEAFTKTILPLFEAYGITDSINSKTQIVQKRKSSYAEFWAGGAYEGVKGSAKSTQATFEQLVEKVLSTGVSKFVQSSSLPEGVKKFFDSLTTKEEVSDAISTLVSLKSQLLDLPDVFDAVRNAIDTTAYDTTIAQLKAQFQATQTFVSLFYSDTEKFNIYTKQLTTQFDALNEALPTSRDEYRALVESINVVDEASRDQYNGLVSLAPAMDEYFKLLQQQADGINEVNQALADGLNQNLFSTFADYASARASVANGMTATGFMGELSVTRSQGDAELASAVKSLVAQQARTDVILAEIADATRRTREINERWNGDGLPETRVM